MRIAMVVAGVVFCAGAVAAPNLEAAIGSCAAQPDAKARLTCYDAVAAQLKPTPAAAVPVPAVQSPVAPKPATAAEFGGEHVKDRVLEPDIPAEEVDEIHAKVTSITFATNGRFTVTLDNGQVWRQKQGDGEPYRFSKKGGDAVTISRGFWHSYNLVLDSGSTLFKVVRER